MDKPPDRLSNDPNHPHFHPSYVRVGIRIDGVERRDVRWYDAPGKMYRVSGSFDKDPPREAETLEAYWRFPESRQQRRARERWEHKYVHG